ncbi:MAG TPA: hypothetical protein VKW06_03520 [Candidatus Angelobacter sp.]|nr:hypothetical protein [Candidatus Angelobacter sp.]
MMTKTKSARRKINAEQGLSLLELVFVVAIVLVIAAMAIPVIRTVIVNYQLDASGQVVAAKLQEARMAAVKANIPYYANFNGAGNLNQPACPTANSVCAAPLEIRPFNPTVDPVAVTSGPVVFQPPNGVNFLQFNGLLGGIPQANGVIGFNGRGQPCVANPANQFICGSQGTPLFPPGGFVWFMQNTRNNGWEAVTVSPTGHIRCWRQTAAGVWQ